ncbi:hypothetical protein VE25_20065 [Devosia geojensis]|uniref:Methyltransferase type 11 domain-containing protein n=1 Tax=Devosia geojensis TaxID=443610 RepID=A0A0F5FFH4_9HYPH|nr:class I SAM-dependent methyltransferase [Devosia geojensis]KKB06952.1 hypothetical protein VE25_20065 [Devosia geojensis]
MMVSRNCWCGSSQLLEFSSEYGRCANCGTLVSLVGLSTEELQVKNDEADFYGKQYWFDHQSKDLGFPDIHARARHDLTDRNLHWLRTLLRYRVPPAKVLELGCSHGSFVGLLQQAGYDASGLEMSPWVVNFAKETFQIPVSVGPVETLDIAPGSLDVIALMDVLEHLPDPVGTMRHCLDLLAPGGFLLIQTPQFREEMTYKGLVETQGPFLEQFKSNEHLYLFTKDSAARMFAQLGAEHIVFETAIFGQYDMFFLVSRQPLREVAVEESERALQASPQARYVQALVDLAKRIDVIEEDRADRLEQIHTLTAMVHNLNKAKQG